MRVKKERRRAGRISIALPARYKKSSEKNNCWTRALCKNICGLGFGLTVSKPLRVNSLLDMLITQKGTGKKMLFKCKVIWCIKDGSGLFRVGLEIRKAKDPLMFIEFIGDIMLNLHESSVTVCRKESKEDR